MSGIAKKEIIENAKRELNREPINIILPGEEEKKKMIKKHWSVQEKLRTGGIILILFGLGCQIIGLAIMSNWKISLIGCILMIGAIPTLLTSSEIGRRKSLKQKEE